MDLDPASSTIKVRVDDVLQLFNTLDPTPFWDRDIDSDAEDFIVDWARDLPKRQPIKIVIYVRDAQAQKFNAVQVNEALNRYGFVSEGLSILGWVANWKPMEIFLYDWWPLAQRRNLYRRLSEASVEIRDGAVLA